MWILCVSLYKIFCIFLIIIYKTFNNESLGSRNDEERSKVRKLM